MADPINATAILAQAQADASLNADAEDQSLNAGAELPEEPIPDVLTNEVVADVSTIREMLPKLNADTAVAQESNFSALSYLRQDLRTQRGMTQRIATEALQILPNFGKGRPVNHYSKHPSQTGYALAIEEIEEAMASDVANQIEEQAVRLTPEDPEVAANFVKELDFKRRADQVAMLECILRDFIRISTDNGFNWDDQTFQGCAVDPSQNACVPESLKLDKIPAYSFATMDSYYMAHLQGVVLMEQMTLYLGAWRDAFQSALEQAEAGDKVSVDVPKAPSVVLQNGKSISVEFAQDAFRTAYNECAQEFDNMRTIEWLTKMSSAAQQSKVQDITERLPDFNRVGTELAGVLKTVAQHLRKNESVAEPFHQLLTKFVPAVSAMLQGRGEITMFCTNACLATSYAGHLGAKVVEHAWQSVNQCKDTMQMPEDAYNELKALVKDMQAPRETGAL